MRVNIYAEEMTNRVEIISKEIGGQQFTGVRLYLELPVTIPHDSGCAVRSAEVRQVKGPFMHQPNDDDSSAITFWGKRDLRQVLVNMMHQLDLHYSNKPPNAGPIDSDI